MSSNKTNLESRILTFSAILCLGFAVMGVVVGLWVGSLVIVFDGAYSLISLLLTLLSLVAAKYIANPSRTQFPLGLAALEPIVISVKATVILSVVVASLYSAAMSLFSGGRPVDASIATLFGVVNVAGCLLGWLVIKRMNKNLNSGLIDAEGKQWQMDALISLAVLLGFVAAWVLSQTTLAAYSVYADPVMMLLMGGYFLKVPFDMLKGAVLELLNKSADKSVCDQVIKQVSNENDVQPLDISVSAVTKVGNELRVHIDVAIPEDENLQCRDIERTKKSLHHKLNKLPYKLQLNMNLAV
ncbi:cobalt-zinc-cadmium resistance protein [Vibrio ishigakensis]|uniref:Cobalt-zinc-cadmium resistance protein n=1 Tax=Vibrio ishigakensis TaxID=1481914 RepID=A0A0B8PJJ5_9VIBR|nr:cobalt-zinc-cadmium resistance protein [Vibrio ishigakensis]